MFFYKAEVREKLCKLFTVFDAPCEFGLALYQQGDSTIEARKNLLIEQRKDLLEKQAEIAATIDRLNYKIDNYEKICAKVIK